MLILNLGCGTKTSDQPEVVNIDWSILLRLRRRKVVRPIVPLFIRGKRLERFNALPDNIVVHNVAKGIPFSSGCVDAVYHSHMLEHLDRDVAEAFLLEVKRVLKPGGIHRIVVPDLERVCNAYLAHIARCGNDLAEARNHDDYVGALLEQSVRREAFGTGQQGRFRRLIENMILGDARRRGETHQWMYDRVNLPVKLANLGYREVWVEDHNRSAIPRWDDYGLEVDENGKEYKAGSLYVEARK